MRIVHVITRLILGGAQENTLLSCEGQHARGHDVTLLTGPPIGPEGSLLDRARGGGYRVILINDMHRALNPLEDWRTYKTIQQHIKELNPDIVHTHSSKAGILARLAAARSAAHPKPKILHTIHGLSWTSSTRPIVNNIYKMLERRAARVSDKIICVADAMRDQSLAAHIGRPEQYVTVYSGMETAPYLDPPVPRDEVRRRLALSDQHVVVGTIARLFHLKGHDDLLALAPSLCRKWPNLRFLWVGDGLLRENFEQQIAAMNLRDRFILTGLVPPTEVPQLAGAMDILVHPSRREGLARALPQAALAGKPVITYDIDGNREALIDGQTGLLVPPFDREKLREAIVNLLGDSLLRQSMGAAGRAFALSRFGAAVMIDKLEHVYQSVLTTTH